MNLLPQDLKYFNISRNWKILNPIYESDFIKEIAFNELNCDLENRSIIHNFKFKPLQKFEYPRNLDGCDWRCGRKGRPPVYDKWVKHAACHWIANINMAVALEAFPKRDWRVINSSYHSTVWDGKKTIFDTNFLALGITIEDLRDGINNDPELYVNEPGWIPFHELECEVWA